MERLNRKTRQGAQAYPERIIQFGEGNFLRAFFDSIVYTMNQKTRFNSGVTVAQPLPDGMVGLLNEQDGLYHLNLQGIDKKQAMDNIKRIDAIREQP